MDRQAGSRMIARFRKGEPGLSRHPLVARSRDPRVRQARGFREAAAELTGEILAAEFEAEREGAPRRSEAKKKHLVQPNQRLAAERHPDRDGEHAAIALVARREKGGEPLRLPEDEGFFEALHAGVVLKSAPADPKLGDGRPELRHRPHGPGGHRPERPPRARAHALRRAELDPRRHRRDAAAHAARGPRAHGGGDGEPRRAGGGDRGPHASARSPTPLPISCCSAARATGSCAASARRSAAPPGSSRWSGSPRRSRRRSASPSATSRSSCRAIRAGATARAAPAFDAEPRIGPAWDAGAGRIKPKARSRARRSTATPSVTVITPDLSRPVRDYRISEHYVAGDRIQHPTLGTGVVQGGAGPGKINVHFDDRRSVLVHDRGGVGGLVTDGAAALGGGGWRRRSSRSAASCSRSRARACRRASSTTCAGSSRRSASGRARRCAPRSAGARRCPC